jgi:hypothetical protein
VTCVVADVVPSDTMPSAGLEAQMVGAAAELKRRTTKTGQMTALFRGHRMGDTGELDPIDEEIPDGAIASDPEEMRYALQAPSKHPKLRWMFGLMTFLGVVWIAVATGFVWSQNQWYIGEQEGNVTIFRGVPTTMVGFDLSEPYQTSDLKVADLAETYQNQLEDGIHSKDLAGAQEKVQSLADQSAADSGSGS